MKYRLKWALILAGTCSAIAPLFLHFLWFPHPAWTDPMVLRFILAWVVIGFLFGLVMFNPPRPFVPHPLDVIPVYRSTIEDWRKLVIARLNGATWSDNDDLRSMEQTMRNALNGNVIRRGM